MQNLIKEEDYNKSGIYQIKNIMNNKIYIGSAYNLYNRFRVHKSTLKNGKHDNGHLQNSYFKYGYNNFLFEVIEVCDIENIYEKEQNYIIKNFGKMCYNINIDTTPSKFLAKWNENRKKKFILIDANNIQYEFFGYREASNIIGCTIGAVCQIVNKKSLSCKGWRLPENINYDYKNYRKKKGKGAKIHNVKFLSPNGEIYGPIFNLEKFSKEHNLNSSVFSNLISKRTRYCNGWSLYNGENEHPISKNAKVYNIQIISPDKKIYGPIKNLNKFCLDKNIGVSSLRNLINGKIKKNNYKGWTINRLK
jgi:group I intron endonuclease